MVLLLKSIYNSCIISVYLFYIFESFLHHLSKRILKNYFSAFYNHSILIFQLLFCHGWPKILNHFVDLWNACKYWLNPWGQREAHPVSIQNEIQRKKKRRHNWREKKKKKGGYNRKKSKASKICWKIKVENIPGIKSAG